MYCRNCGNALKPGEAFCSECGCSRQAGSRYCAACGMPANGTGAYCTYCGAHVGVSAESMGRGKSRTLAGVMGILFGGFGVHNFILGYTGKAVAQLLITLLSFFSLYPVSALWGLLEGILILTGVINQDAGGRPLAQ